MTEQLVCASDFCDESFIPNTHNQKYHSPQCKRDMENVNRRRMVQDVAAAVAPMYSEEDRELLGQIEFLRSENQRLARAAEKYKKARHEMVEAVYQAVTDNIKDIQLNPSPSPRLKSASGEPEVAAIGVADWQLGKVTKTYSTEALAERVELYGDRIIRLTDKERADHPVNEAHLWVVGDIIEGEDIFSGQSHLIDSSLYGQVAKHGPKIMSDFIRRLLGHFEKIEFHGVVGNHGSIGGRARREYNDETNMDRMLYKITEHIFSNEPRIKFNIPDGFGERSFWTIDRIGNHATLLVHGDQFPQPSTTHAYLKKVLGWKTGTLGEDFDDVFLGHYHHNMKFTFGNTVVRISGSPESDNTFAQEFVGQMNRPSQHLQYVHPRRGVTAEYDVWLSD
ncbi:MAG TPA: hypothetical protein VJ742_12165 [Nitrososphaera sp.]|nr:hypothetical protein [Nitrososphaera sp.]